MKLIFSDHAWDDYFYWEKTDKKILSRINTLIKETKCTPFEGMGKPEPLKHGSWGRLAVRFRYVANLQLMTQITNNINMLSRVKAPFISANMSTRYVAKWQ